MIKTILCVEDDWFTGEMYVRSLQKAGYDVTWVVDGNDGLVAVRNQQFDLDRRCHVSGYRCIVFSAPVSGRRPRQTRHFVIMEPAAIETAIPTRRFSKRRALASGEGRVLRPALRHSKPGPSPQGPISPATGGHRISFSGKNGVITLVVSPVSRRITLVAYSCRAYCWQDLLCSFSRLINDFGNGAMASPRVFNAFWMPTERELYIFV